MPQHPATPANDAARVVVADDLPAAESPSHVFRVRAVLVASIFYCTYQTHFTVDFGIKGLNLTTLLFVVAVWLVASQKNRSPGPTPLKGFFVAFILALMWGFAIGQLRDGSTVLDDLTVVKNMLFAMLLYFVAFHGSADRRTREILFIAVLGVTALVILHLWRQALDYGIGVYNETRRASGPFGTTAAASNRAAAFLIIFLPVMLTAAIYLRGRPYLRWGAAIFTVLGVGGVFFTYSRQAYLAVALLFVYIAFRRNWALALLIAAAVLSYESWAPQGVIDRVESTHQEDEYGEETLDESAESRFIIWAGAAQMIQDHPLGIGLNRFAREIGSYVPRYAGLDAHNNYIRFAVEAGPVAAIMMVTLLLALLLFARRVETVDASDDSRLLGSALLVSVLGVMLCNLYGSRFFDVDVMSAFWILAGLSARHYAASRDLAARREATAASSARQTSA